MVKKTVKFLSPDYMKNFSCIGSECEDSCCSGWGVYVDQSTYKKYNKVKDKDMKKRLDESVKRVKKDPHSQKYAMINLNPQGHCPLLDGDSLCSVHKNLGENYLSNVCSSYPKTYNTVDSVFERSASISCPEIARLALLNPNTMTFDETIEESNLKGIISKNINIPNFQKQDVAEQYFWELRIFTIQLLQNRKYSLEERMIILGMFYQKAQEHIDNNKVEEIPNLIGLYINLLETETLKGNIKDINPSYQTQVQLLNQLITFRLSLKQLTSRYIDCLDETLQGLGHEQGVTKTEEQIIEDYKIACQNYYIPFVKNKGYVIENYLVNYVFKSLFPYSKGMTMFEEYQLMVVTYALIKLHLVGLTSHHKEDFNDDIIVKFMQSFSRNIEHNPFFMQKIFEMLKENGLNKMSYMAILLKN